MSTSQYQLAFFVVFVVYTLALSILGHLTSRRKNDGENFITGGKSLQLLPLIGTIGATMIGTGLSMGATANGYNYGWGGSIFALGSTLGMVSLCIYTPLRKYSFNTMPEEAQFYYEGKQIVRNVTSAMMLLTEIIWVSSAINGGSKYLDYITGMGSVSTKTITTLAFLAFTIFGGYLSVVWTDTVQFGIIIAGFFAIVIKAVPAAGGLAAIESAFTAAGNGGALGLYGLGSYGVMPALSLVCSAYFGAMGTQSFRIRIYTAKDEPTARKGFLLGAAMIFAFSLMPSIIGMSAFAITSRNGVLLESADFAFTYMAMEVLPPLLGLFFMIAGVSATLSSADSNALSGVAIVLSDLYPTITGRTIPPARYKRYSRIAILMVTALAYLLSLYATDIIRFISDVAGSLVPGIAICMLLGRLWKRATWQGGLACIFAGTLFGLAYLLLPSFAALSIEIFGGASIPAALLSLGAGVLVSLCTPPGTLTEEERLQLVWESRHE